MREFVAVRSLFHHVFVTALTALFIVATLSAGVSPAQSQSASPHRALVNALYDGCLKFEFPDVEHNVGKPLTAFDPKTGRNFAYDKDNRKWIDIKTGEAICPEVKSQTVKSEEHPIKESHKKPRRAKKQPADADDRVGLKSNSGVSPETARAIGTVIDIGIGFGLSRAGRDGGDDKGHFRERARPRD